MMTNRELFEEGHSIAEKLIFSKQYPWEVLSEIKSYIIELGKSLPEDKYEYKGDNVWIARDAEVYPSALIKGPCIVDCGAEVRHCAFIRGSAIIGKGAVVGNSVELKNAILSDGAQTPHYNYVGDSILGYKAHMGAGSITSNLKSDKKNIAIKADCGNIDTGMRKIGAFLGDNAEIGCNSVLNPGTVIGSGSIVYPLSCVRGVVPKNSIYKTGGIVVERENR